MTPKEKAKELYDKMLQWQTDGNIYIQRNIASLNYKSKKEKIQPHYQVATTEIIEEEDNITDRSITPRDKNDYYTD